MIKHAGVEKTGGLSNDELLDMMKPIREGILNADSFSQHKDFIRYAYDLDSNGVRLRLVIEEHNDGKKVFDFYSDRNFTPKQADSTQATKSILESAKNAKQAQKEAKELAQKQANEEFYARYNAEKARQEAVLAQRESSEGLSDLAAHEANFTYESDIPTKQLQSTTIALNKDEIYPAHFVIVDKNDLKPRFSKGNFQFKQGMKADEVQSVANDFKPELLFEKSGEYEGLPLIARDGQIIAGNHRAQGIKDFSQESLKKHQEYAKAKFGVELAENEVIVRQIDKDVPLHTQLRLAQASNAGNANNRLGEQILAEAGKAQPYIEKLPHKIQADSFESLQSAVANALNMPNAQQAANRALFAHLAKGTGSKDLISILDKPRNNGLDDLIKAQELYFKNAGEFYNLSKNTALSPELNLNDYLLQALDSTLSLAGKERGQVFKELSDDINDFIATGGGLSDIISKEHQIKTLKGRVLGAGIAKYVNQIEGGASQLNKVLRDLPAELAEEFSPSLTNPSGKALKDVNMYDFLDYFIRVTKHNNNSVSELAQSLQALREFERGKVPTTKSTKHTKSTTPKILHRV